MHKQIHLQSIDSLMEVTPIILKKYLEPHIEYLCNCFCNLLLLQRKCKQSFIINNNIHYFMVAQT